MSTEQKPAPKLRVTASDEQRSQDRLQYGVMVVAGVITAVFFVALCLAN